jgi:hypothetical protein
MAAGALGSAGEAQASCVSAGGWFSIGNGCTTTKFGDFALAIGPGATATAAGGFNTAFSMGEGAVAYAVGKFNSATAKGIAARAEAVGGWRNTAIAIGDAAADDNGTDPQQARYIRTGAYAVAGNNPLRRLADGSEEQVPNHGNTAIAIGNSARSGASGVHSTAYSLGTGAIAEARGIFNRAFAKGTQAGAWAIDGRNNTAIAIGDPAEAPNDGGDPAERASVRLLTTRAGAGNLDSLGGGKAEKLQQDPGTSVSGDNNTAISIGNGSVAGAGNGSRNYARVLGNRSVAGALGGNGNRALVFGDDSTASAGRARNAATEAETRMAAEPSNGNTAIVKGNESRAFAGPGLRNLARVIGDRSTARAQGVKQRDTVTGDDVNPPKDEPQK